MKLNKGFSLFELFVVIVIVNILVAVAIPSMRDFYKTYKYIEYATRMENIIKWARIVAMEKSINVGVCVETSRLRIVNMGTRRAYPCSGETINILEIDPARDISIAGSSASFDPKGFAINTGNVCITNGAKYSRVFISRFGAIRVEKGDGGCT